MLSSLAACIGVSAFIFPLVAPLSLFVVLAISILTVASAPSRSSFFISTFLSVGLLIGVAGGLFSAEIVIAVLSAVIIAPCNRALALLILVLQTSYASTLEALFSNYLHIYQLEVVAPSILCGIVLLATPPVRKSWWKASLIFLPVPIVKAGLAFSVPPYSLMLLSAIPVFSLVFLDMGRTQTRRISRIHKLGLITVIMLMVLGWTATLPKTPSDRYVLLPRSIDSPEYRFYDRYQETLLFAGMDLKVTADLDGIPKDSLVLLPWLTSANLEESFSLQKLREHAKTRAWTVVMIGEHTNMGGVANRIASLTGRDSLRHDISVPPGNTDYSGHLRAAGMQAWPPNALLNRGATVEVQSLFDRILLAGDGWWAEPDIGEWLWVGDYIWQPTDRHGRIVMAASMEDGNARWVVVGDTSPFINQQLISDPRAAVKILELATLWPLLIRDIGILFVGIVFILGGGSNVAITVFGLALLGGLVQSEKPHGQWLLLWQDLSAFDERNFNKSLLQSDYLLSGNWNLIRQRDPLSGRLELPTARTVIFGLVEDQLHVGNVKISLCKRLGSLATKGGPYLMDAQACLVEGGAHVLLGDMDGAAVIKLGRGDSTLILVLDRNFLGQKAPLDNVKWLDDTLKSESNDLN